MYNDLRKQLTRDFRSTLSGVRGYAEGALDYHAERRKIMLDKDVPLPERRAQIVQLRECVGELSIILFTYALYLRFLSGDAAVKNAVAAFESLEVKKVWIGTMELSRGSKYYDMGRTLATKLVKCIKSPELLEMFKSRSNFYEVVDWFKRERQ